MLFYFIRRLKRRREKHWMNEKVYEDKNDSSRVTIWGLFPLLLLLSPLKSACINYDCFLLRSVHVNMEICFNSHSLRQKAKPLLWMAEKFNPTNILSTWKFCLLKWTSNSFNVLCNAFAKKKGEREKQLKPLTDDSQWNFNDQIIDWIKLWLCKKGAGKADYISLHFNSHVVWGAMLLNVRVLSNTIHRERVKWLIIQGIMLMVEKLFHQTHINIVAGWRGWRDKFKPTKD